MKFWHLIWRHKVTYISSHCEKRSSWQPLLTHYNDDTIIEPASQNVCYLSDFLRGKIFASHITDLSALYIKRPLKLIKEERLTALIKNWTKDYVKIYSQ